MNKIFIMLGPRCNFHCRHCLQTDNLSMDDGQKISNALIHYLSYLAEKSENKITIQPWGGEPLIYWDKIVELVAALGDGFNYGIVSNGALLTQEMVNFINQHGLSFTLSHDGLYTDKVRDRNMLDDDNFCKLFAQIEKKSFCTVFHAHNQDPGKLTSYLKARFDIPIFWEFLVCSWKMPADIYAFDLVRVRNAYRKLFNKAKNSLKSNVKAELGIVNNLTCNVVCTIQKLQQGNNILAYPKCNPSKVLNVDLVGNVYACHNFSFKIGTIEDDFSTLMKNYDALISKYRSKKKCASCKALAFCRGGCPFTKSETCPGVDLNCEIQKIRYEECIRFISECDNLAGGEL